jgi:short-subunit dehydrogenase
MKPQLNPLQEQTIVVTGASSGHGLATALLAAQRGARVVLVARDEDDLRQVRDRIRSDGGQAEYAVADVGREEDVERVARTAVERFGGFDTWVNNAGVGIYGSALKVSVEDHRRLFDTNYWGVVNGTLAAARHLRDRPGGGAIINVGSINSDIASPLLSAYNASKHAVQGFTDSFRIEMIRDGAPISVTLIKPSAIGTPFPEHGRNVTGHESRLPPPMYAPEVVAKAILFAAETPRRSLTVGGAGRLQVAAEAMFPGLFDRLASNMGPLLTRRDEPTGFEPGNLHEPTPDGPHVDGRQKGRSVSLYTTAQTHPGATGALLAAGGVAAAVWLLQKAGRGDDMRRLARDAKEGMTDPQTFKEHARHRMEQAGLR